MGKREALKQYWAEDIVQLAKFSLAGRRQDVEMYLRRIARKASKRDPLLAEEISKMLSSGLSRKSPLRGIATATLPVDRDSRLNLMRVDQPNDHIATPILERSTADALESVLKERRKEQELYSAGLSPTRTVLFTGPPGVGKTISARWLANELGLPLVTLDLSAVMSSCLGRTGTNIRTVLDYAKQHKCALLLDELDAIAKRRDDSLEVGELKRLVTVLLQEMDDWPPSGLLVASTNHPSLLDPAIWRRFELTISFLLPSNKQILDFASKELGPIGTSELVIEALSLALDGYSLAEVERDLRRLKRIAVLEGGLPAESVGHMLSSKLETIKRENRITMAVKLVKAGYSQREVADLVRVSRDTIRNKLPSKKRSQKDTK